MASVYSSVLLSVNYGGSGPGSGSVPVPPTELWVLKQAVFNNNDGFDNQWAILDGIGTAIAGGAISTSLGATSMSPGVVTPSWCSDCNLNGIQVVDLWQVLTGGDSLQWECSAQTNIRVSGYRIPVS